VLRCSKGRNIPYTSILCEKRHGVKKAEEVESMGFFFCQDYLINVMKKRFSQGEHNAAAETSRPDAR
jgi:hypothetical protein